MDASKLPSQLNDARGWYYSRIECRPRDLVSVFTAADGQNVTDDKPGTAVLHLEPRFRSVRLWDADGRERGLIRAEGRVPGGFVLRRDGNPVWILGVRSFVRKRHRLELVDADAWMFDTPFFWWQHVTGSITGIPTLLGGVGPSAKYWGFKLEPGRETVDLLGAVAFMHWKWWRWQLGHAVALVASFAVTMGASAQQPEGEFDRALEMAMQRAAPDLRLHLFRMRVHSLSIPTKKIDGFGDEAYLLAPSNPNGERAIWFRKGVVILEVHANGEDGARRFAALFDGAISQPRSTDVR